VYRMRRRTDLPHRPDLARMTIARKAFRREGEDIRRTELVQATLSCIAQLGMERTTVREIAIKAGVTPGLIRHYFTSKDDLVLAAYIDYVGRLSEQSREAVANAIEEPTARLSTFIAANLSVPIVDRTNLSLWAGFIEAVRFSKGMAEVHRDGYMDYRNDAETLISNALKAQRRIVTKPLLRRYGIALNAIIDGLWLEGSISPEEFQPGELAQIGIDLASALLGINLKINGKS
jgi:TetR/AcrR family transcriptional regulator, transcriptional repressor of bet genes